MYQASQRAVVQNTNMGLVNIRSAEIAYFSDFFANFGIQSAIIAQSISGVVSQTPALEGYPCAYFWCFIYFTSSAAALVGAGHVLLTTLFISVYGQGLALRGPLGSMAHTIDGMVYEQHQVVLVFVITMIFFVLQEASMFMVVMDEIPGYISVAIVMLSGVFTYMYCQRIYNRFYFDKETVEWNDDPNPVADLNEMLPDTDASILSIDKKHSSTPPRGRYTPPSAPLTVIHEEQDGSCVDGHSTLGTEPHFQSAAAAAATSPLATAMRNRMEGYLAVKSNKRFTADPWDRRYFVLVGTSIFYYPDKKAFQRSPTEPLNRRAIDLEGYTLIAGTTQAPYAISLVPADSDDIRKAWKFRCDTLNEFNSWIEKFDRALKMCSSALHGGGSDLVVLSPGDLLQGLSDADAE